jgi:hypothetical protein
MNTFTKKQEIQIRDVMIQFFWALACNKKNGLKLGHPHQYLLSDCTPEDNNSGLDNPGLKWYKVTVQDTVNDLLGVIKVAMVIDDRRRKVYTSLDLSQFHYKGLHI